MCWDRAAVLVNLLETLEAAVSFLAKVEVANSTAATTEDAV